MPEDPNFKPCYFRGRVDLTGTTFGSKARITVELEKAGLTAGECSRVVEDVLDQIAAMEKTVRWEHLVFDKMYVSASDGPWEEVERGVPRG